MVKPEDTAEQSDRESSQRSPGSQDARIGQVLAARYRVRGCLGSGGMGSVYLAEHIHMRKTFALKVLHQEMTALDEAVKRFEREAIASSRIQHPNVTTATDFGRLDDGSFYLVLEYVAGTPLGRVLERERLLAEPRVLHIAGQICAALAAAHREGIVHRDLKPENVMLTTRAGDPDFVKVLDFGIAKLHAEVTGHSQMLTQAGAVFGTPEYMAPEQAAGRPVDARADLYALGVMMFEMLSGEPPFVSDNLMRLLAKHLTEAPPPLPANITPRLRELVAQLLSKEPEQRPASAEVVEAALSELLQDSARSSKVVRRAKGEPRRWFGLAAAASERGEPARGWFGKAAAPSPSSQVREPAASAPHGVPAAAERARAALAEGNDHSTVLENTGAAASEPARRPGSARAEPDGRAGMQLTQPASGLHRQLSIGSWSIRVWHLLLGATLITGIVLGRAASTYQPSLIQSGEAGQGRAASEPKPDDELAARGELRLKVAQGDPAAFDELDQLPDADREASDWLALGLAHAVKARAIVALDHFRRAIELDPSFREHRELLAHVRELADDPQAYQPAQALAANHLGQSGADLLFDVWAAIKEKTDVTGNAKQLLDDETVRRNASPALQAALALREASSCPEVKQLLPEVEANADERAVFRLRRLQSDRGCGFLGLSDCYGCLRGSSAVSDALRAASSRPQPRFATPTLR